MQVRFGISGLLSNIIFMVLYNVSVSQFEESYPASTIYAVVYFLFIPLSHALTSLLVFGWPRYYLTSLLSNYPIGLTAIALGSALTGYFHRVAFNEGVEDFIRTYITWKDIDEFTTDDDKKGEFYSSLVVLVVTSLWTYVLSVMVNAPSADETKKEKEL